MSNINLPHIDTSIFDSSGLPNRRIFIIPIGELTDARNYYERANSLYRELEFLQHGLMQAQATLQEGDSCTAVDILLRITEESPRGKRALEIFKEVQKLMKNVMVLCAEKIAEHGGYQRARAILQPYADEDDRFQKVLGKITDRQNKEMTEKARQKKELMEELKAQSRIWFALGVAASILGGILLLGGAIGAFWGKVSAGVLSSVSAILPGILAALFYNQSDKLRTERIKLSDKTLDEEKLDHEILRKVTGVSDQNKTETSTSQVISEGTET